jgi:hypothetical protein
VTADEFSKLLLENSKDNNLADQLEKLSPDCGCENVQLGAGSPGKVEDNEDLVRVMVSPRDYDKNSDRIAQKPFEKLFASGLSVMRSIATNDDFLEIARDGLWSKKEDPVRSVQELCSVKTHEVREMLTEAGKRKFCVYDQVVPRNRSENPPVPTHAGIFQREILSGVKDAKRLNRDLAHELYKKFSDNAIKVESFRQHLFADLNARAAAGEFVIPDETATT